MKILLKVDYTDDTGKFWQDSYIKNRIFEVKGTIHETIAEAVKETDGVVLSYGGKPQTNVFIDDKNGESKAIGYIYRGKTEIHSDKSGKYEKALFDVWVTIKEVKDIDIEIIE